MLYSVVYTSLVADGVGKDDIDAIVASAQKNNPGLNITGVLFYKGGIFLQLIEGPKKAVLTLYDRIKEDERHKEVTTVYTGFEEDRNFTDWAMAYKDIQDMDVPWINSILQMQKPNSDIVQQIKDLTKAC